MSRWILRRGQSGMLIDPVSRRTYVFAKGTRPAPGAQRTCPLLAGGGAGATYASRRVRGTDRQVWKRRYDWGPNTILGARGPNLQVPAVGKVQGFVLDHSAFPMD